MKVTQSAMLSSTLREECARLGARLARLRIARNVKQTDAALRAGLSRNTVYRLE
jgi:DNA-binding XRE family transcriptional regulator